MLTYPEAMSRVLEHAAPLPPEPAPLASSLGRVLASDIIASEAIPPFDNSAMDGFAVQASDCTFASPDHPVALRVLGDLGAGYVAAWKVEPGTAIRIMTGAPIPEGADAVVPVERTLPSEIGVQITKAIRPGGNIRRAGEDIAPGTCVIQAGTLVTPAHLGVLATLGCAQVQVRPQARIAVLTSGDELVDISTQPGPGQIRDSNIHILCGQVQAAGAIPIPMPRIPDRQASLEEALLRATENAHAILTAGGMSVGDFDFVKSALNRLGAQQIFWRIAQKPGGPFGLWLLHGKPVFGLPGNPAAAMVIFEEFVRPALRKMMGHPLLFRPERRAILEEGWQRRRADDCLHILKVAAWETEKGWHAATSGFQGSGVLTTMMRANALVLVEAHIQEIPPGGHVTLHCLDAPENH